MNTIGDKVSERRSLTMSHIKSNNTSIEVLLRRTLWHEGIRYRKNYKILPGKPDIAITKYRIAIFCDGEFWHGKNWKTKKDIIKTNRDYWIKKIERNITRDNSNEKKLENMGWVVLRFWGNEIQNNLDGCVSEIKETIYQIDNGLYRSGYDDMVDFMVAENEPIYNVE